MQTVAVEELYVIDDGSTDDSVRLCEAEGIRVIKMGHNKGRGAARAKAMSLIHCELVLCCDATLALSEDFLEIALRHFGSKFLFLPNFIIKCSPEVVPSTSVS